MDGRMKKYPKAKNNVLRNTTEKTSTNKKHTQNTHFREPDKLTFRAQPDAPNLRLWWINTRGVVQNASSSPKIRDWILECSTVTKRSSLKRVGTFQTIDNKIRTAMQAIVKPELASKFLVAHERCEKEDPGRDLTGREMIWMLFDYLKQASNRHSYTDYEDLASVKLHGKRLGKFWEAPVGSLLLFSGIAEAVWCSAT